MKNTHALPYSQYIKIDNTSEENLHVLISKRKFTEEKNKFLKLHAKAHPFPGYNPGKTSIKILRDHYGKSLDNLVFQRITEMASLEEDRLKPSIMAALASNKASINGTKDFYLIGIGKENKTHVVRSENGIAMTINTNSKSPIKGMYAVHVSGLSNARARASIDLSDTISTDHGGFLNILLEYAITGNFIPLESRSELYISLRNSDGYLINPAVKTLSNALTQEVHNIEAKIDRPCGEEKVTATPRLQLVIPEQSKVDFMLNLINCQIEFIPHHQKMD